MRISYDFTVISCLLAVQFSVCGQAINLQTDALTPILKQYVTTNPWHDGDLYEHSVWVAKIVEKWFDEHNDWVEGLSNADKRVMIWTGFLHDIGKAGDLQYIYYDKPNHPIDGMYYLMGNKPFYVDERQIFNFDAWFERQNISSADHKLIAALIGVHWDFGGIVLRGMKNGEQEEKLFDAFIAKLSDAACQTGYNNGQVDRKLVCMAMLINAADVRGSKPVEYSGNLFFADNCEAHRCGCDQYQILDFEGHGKKVRRSLLNYFDGITEK